MKFLRAALGSNRPAHSVLTARGLVWWIVGSVTAGATAQFPTTIRGVTVLPGDGPAIVSADLTFVGASIVDVSGSDERPTGQYVTPGLIDAYSRLGLIAGSSGVPTGRAADAWNPYDARGRTLAWSQGVTMVYLPASAGDGLTGVGAVVRLLAEGERKDRLIEETWGLCSDVAGREGTSPIARERALSALRDRFRAAKDYRQAKLDYESELEDYEKALKERAEKEAAGGTPDEAKKPEGEGGGDPPPAARERGERRGRGPRGDRSTPPAEAPKPEGETKDEIKKPAEPAVEPDLDLLLRAIDGELRWFAAVDEPQDVDFVLDIAEEFELAVTLVRAGAAAPFAERIAELDASVILAPDTTPLAERWSYVSPPPADIAALLAAQDASIVFGSFAYDAENLALPSLTLIASSAVGRGLDADAAMRALTWDAARALGVSKDYGKLARGYAADLVVWSGHPLNSASRVVQVYIAGQEVYNAENQRGPQP